MLERKPTLNDVDRVWGMLEELLGRDIPTWRTLADENITLLNGREQEQYDAGASKWYLESLAHMKQGSITALAIIPTDLERGTIVHMRNSPEGRWLVVCHINACVVYDVTVCRLNLYALSIRCENTSTAVSIVASNSTYFITR